MIQPSSLMSLNLSRKNVLGFFVRYYSKRSKRNSPSKKALKLASTVGSSKKKSFKPAVFHYGNFSGLKENATANPERAARLISKITEFEHLKLLPQVRQAVKQLIFQESLVRGDDSNTIRPSPIQVISVKELASSLMVPKLQTHAIAAETGSGKTMAYFAPMLDYLKRQEEEDPERWQRIHEKAIIRSIILVPTHELVDQVYDTISKSEELLDMHTFRWRSGMAHSELLEAVKKRIDILVTTPAKLLSLFHINMISRPDKILSQVKFVVLDEADTLLDQSWVEDTYSAINKLPNANHVVFCSATIPNEFNKTLQRLFPTVIPITTPRLHKLPNSLEFKVIDAAVSPYKNSKIKALAQILYAITNDGTEPNSEKRCIVFVNEKRDIPKLVEKLTHNYGHTCVGLSGDDAIEERSKKIQAFVQPPKPLPFQNSASGPQESVEDFQIPESNITIPSGAKGQRVPFQKLKVLITTDLMARGLNFQALRNVILFDVPKTSIDLVHRVGRTGRMHQGGRVFMIVDKSTKSWAKAVPKVARKNMTLV